MTLNIGDIIDSKYKLGTILGTGPTGWTYQATDISQQPHKVVVIKIVPTELQVDATRINGLKDELAALQRLSENSNIVQILDHKISDGNYYFVKEYKNKGNLRQYLSNKPSGLGTIELAIELFQPIADALEFAHRKGIFHGDVKLDNILLDDSDGRGLRAFLNDFDVSSAKSTTTTRAIGVGSTAIYTAPELINTENEKTIKGDVYALGIALYEALEGRPPFKKASIAWMLRLPFLGRPIYPKTIEAKSNIKVVKVILRAFHKNSNKRYERPTLLIEELKAAAKVKWFELLAIRLTRAATWFAGLAIPVMIIAAIIAIIPNIISGSSAVSAANTQIAQSLTDAYIATLEEDARRTSVPLTIQAVGSLSAQEIIASVTNDAETRSAEASRTQSVRDLTATSASAALMTASASVPTATLLTPSASQTPPEISFLTVPIQAIINNTGVNLRSGPGGVYPRLATAVLGESIDVIASTSNKDWYLIQRENDERAILWVSATFVRLSDELQMSAIPTVMTQTIPAPPTQSNSIAATSTPILTAVIQPTTSSGSGSGEATKPAPTPTRSIVTTEVGITREVQTYPPPTTPVPPQATSTSVPPTPCTCTQDLINAYWSNLSSADRQLALQTFDKNPQNGSLTCNEVPQSEWGKLCG
jgi:uncharacterized protein YgiM (DUF1202 family)